MKLTKSTTICYISDSVPCITKVNVIETFMGNDGFLQMFMWWMDRGQRIKYLLLDKFSIWWGKDGFLLLCQHSGKLLALC